MFFMYSSCSYVILYTQIECVGLLFQRYRLEFYDMGWGRNADKNFYSMADFNINVKIKMRP